MTPAWQWAIGAVAVGIALVASSHAVLFKRDPRAAALWVIVIWLMPLVGSCLYFLFGINRIRRHALSLRGGQEKLSAPTPASPGLPTPREQVLPANGQHLAALARLVDQVVARPLLPGNRVTPLRNGEEAYPAMRQAIQDAQTSISLATYIFDHDAVGLQFAKDLGDAVRRGVEVRVLIDAAGLRYSWPTILKTLHSAGIPAARFLPSLAPWKLTTLNLRNHRKIMVVDGQTSFTGGMNIRAGHLCQPATPDQIQDLHFKVQGPVVAQLQEVFVNDWSFTTRERLRGPSWFPHPQPCGPVIARGISDGPDEDFEKLRWSLLGALSLARRRIHIITPYFLPDSALISALNVAAMRGVQVHILLPEQNNLPYVNWATSALLWQVLERGCRVWLTPPPFDHSKLMLVDECWVLIGSANWDPRSLRLNFEFNLECYDPALAAQCQALLEGKQKTARELSLADVDGRPLPIRLRDGLARLLIPFL